MVSIQHTVWTCSSLQLSFCPLPWSFHKAIFALGMLPYNLSLWFHPHWSVNKLRAGKFFYHFSQFSCSVVSDTLLPHGLQHARLLCLSPTPGAYSNSCPLSWWCQPTISSSVVPFSSHLQFFRASGSFQMSQFFTSSGQSIGVSASASVLPMNIQDRFPLGWTDWISLQSKGLLRIFSNKKLNSKAQFFGAQLSL